MPKDSGSKRSGNGRFRDRIVDLRRVKASVLRRNPRNWRRHPPEQQVAMQSMLEEIGYAGATIAYEDEDGQLTLIDGHLRADIADEDEVPVLVTDLDEEEAKRLLATFDVLGGMADVDVEALDELVSDMEFDSLDLELALDEILDEHPEEDEGDGDEGEETRRRLRDAGLIPEMELTPQEHYDYVLVICRRRTDWHRLSALLELEDTRKRRTRKVGLGRVVEASDLLKLIPEKG